MLFSLLLSLSALACPNLSGTYKDQHGFLLHIRQNDCKSVSMQSQDDTPEEFLMDCQLRSSGFGQNRNCWIDNQFTSTTFGRSQSGKWIPFMRRYLRLDTQTLYDKSMVTNHLGEDVKESFSGSYERVSDLKENI